MVLASAFLLGACATDGTTDGASVPGASAGNMPALAETNWKITTIDGAAPISDQNEIAFSEDRMSGTVGCNRIFGLWKVEKGKLAGGPYATTNMWCEGLMDQERIFTDLLNEQPDIQLTEDELILRSASHEVRLHPYTPAPEQGE